MGFPTTAEAVPSVTSEEIEVLRTKVRSTLSNAHTRSVTSHNPLLVMVGVDHISNHSAILECLIYQEAEKLGIKDIAFELPRKAKSAEIKEMIEQLPHLPLCRSNLRAQIVTYKQANHYNHKIHLVDGRCEVGDYHERNETMAANIARIPRSTIFMVGSKHILELTDMMKKHKTHELVSFDVTDQSLFDSPYLCHISTHRMAVKGDTKTLTFDQFTQLALGKHDADAFITWTETHKYKLPVTELIKQNSEIEENLKKDPKNISLLKQYTENLYELGDDEKAGAAFARLLVASSIGAQPNNPRMGKVISNIFVRAMSQEMERLSETESAKNITFKSEINIIPLHVKENVSDISMRWKTLSEPSEQGNPAGLPINNANLSKPSQIKR